MKGMIFFYKNLGVLFGLVLENITLSLIVPVEVPHLCSTLGNLPWPYKWKRLSRGIHMLQVVLKASYLRF